ncbi:MAG: GrpB family protein [Actinomycetota bacterium]|nr:GrpB family protein [Actinomycetota bacterium]
MIALDRERDALLEGILVGGLEPLVVDLHEHDPGWSAIYEANEPAIRQALGSTALIVEHLGSTSVPGLVAKPVVDILQPARPHATLGASPGGLTVRGRAVSRRGAVVGLSGRCWAQPGGGLVEAPGSSVQLNIQRIPNLSAQVPQ